MTKTESTKTTEAPHVTEADWSLVDHDIVAEIVQSVAAKVAEKYRSLTTVEDEAQNAMIHVATNAERVREYLAHELVAANRIFRWLEHRLVDGLKTDANRASIANVSYDELRDGAHADNISSDDDGE